jgi:hypothetical protein
VVRQVIATRDAGKHGADSTRLGHTY